MSENVFYIVWNPLGRNPEFRHPTRESACHEAERLARADVGAVFYVLAAVSKSQKRDVDTEELYDGIPF